MGPDNEWLAELADAVSEIPDPGIDVTVSAQTAEYLAQYIAEFGDDEEYAGLPDNFRVAVPVGVVRELVRGMH